MFDFFAGVMVGLALGVSLTAGQYNTGKDLCQEDLPRSQQCIIKWEVDNGDK